MKKILTKNEHLVVIALFAVAKKLMKKLDDIEETLVEILGEEGVGGHVQDEIYGGSADGEKFIKRHGIKVKK